ncbi:MAG: hypothetical protein FJ291_02880 [Planctomycetes bacterium]|nr:hypothetical protein [Planctomycetota bacterium]
MSDTTALEDRVKALESDIAELKRREGREETVCEWLDRISGRLAKYPEFEEVVRLGREMRQADRPDDES